jgi:hypothetical protein
VLYFRTGRVFGIMVSYISHALEYSLVSTHKDSEGIHARMTS